MITFLICIIVALAWTMISFLYVLKNIFSHGSPTSFVQRVIMFPMALVSWISGKNPWWTW